MVRKIFIAVIIALSLLLAASVGHIVYTELFCESETEFVSYLQDKDELFNMECGIINNCRAFRDGADEAITYDFDNPYYDTLKEKYNVTELAGEGGELDKALRLMDNLSARLSHNGSYADYTKEMNAADILEFALDKPENGIFCRAKAQVFNEIFLSLHIYSRKLWLNSLSVYDEECHVVNEIWDSGYSKWIMLDTTNNLYWVDENGLPLSALEIREKLALQEFTTPVKPGESLTELEKLRDKHEGFVLYTAKNMAYLQYFIEYGEGEADTIYALLPESMEPWDSCVISERAVTAAP